MARVALLACVGGLAFVVCAFGTFLLYFLLACAFLTIAFVTTNSSNTALAFTGEQGRQNSSVGHHGQEHVW